MTATRTLAPLRFGRFELQPKERRFLVDGQPIAVGARAFDLLVALVERAGRLVAKNELLELVWPGLVVEENNLQVQVSTLRKLLGPTAVATIPGRGYRFELPIDGARVSPTATAPDTTTPQPPARHASDSVRARTNLPTHLPLLYGRDQDLQQVKALLRKHVVVTIAGAGGIGKTRLARAVAADVAVEHASDYPDGVWWVELAALSDGTLVPANVARALDVQLTGDRAASDTLVTVLASQQLMLVLDNCEHLTDAVADLIEAICASAPKVRMLVTSQETLKTTEEHVFRVGALALPVDDGRSTDPSQAGAVELFVARAQGVDPNFALTPAHAPAVIEICRRLDGIPLAIELAAARLPLLGVEGLRARLGERFNVLTAGARVVLRRHQTLRATLEWSHALLTQDEQTVFRRLGVFAGSFTLEAAQHVASDERIDAWVALDHLGALVDKSLVLAEGDPVPRYRLLETTRAYALERLAEARETDQTLRRHAESLVAVLSEFERNDRRWRGTLDQFAAAAAELDNLRAAIAWVDTATAGGDLAVRLASVSYRVWMATSQLAEGLDRCVALRRHLRDDTPARDAARFWDAIARLGQYSTNRECYAAAQRAADLYRKLGDDKRLYDALASRASQGIRYGEVEQVQQAIDEATALERPEWPPRQRASLEFSRYRWNTMIDRNEAALACALRQVALYREDGIVFGELVAMSNVAAAEIALGYAEAALEHARTAIERLRTIGSESAAGHLHLVAATALTLLGRSDEAIAEGRMAYALLMREADEFRLLSPLALNAALQGRLADAARITGLVDVVHERTGEVPVPAVAGRRARLDALLKAGLTAEALAQLKAAGAMMREADAFKLAFGDVG